MRREEALYAAAWLRIAERDLARVEQLLDIQDPGAASFYLQQAVEKFLKAFLISKGWKLQRVHDLEALLNAALAHDPSLEPFRAPVRRSRPPTFLHKSYPATPRLESPGFPRPRGRRSCIGPVFPVETGIQ